MNNDTAILLGLSPLENHEIVARFDGGALPLDGGVLILRQLEHQLKFADMIAGCMAGKRDPERRAQDFREATVCGSGPRIGATQEHRLSGGRTPCKMPH